MCFAIAASVCFLCRPSGKIKSERNLARRSSMATACRMTLADDFAVYWERLVSKRGEVYVEGTYRHIGSTS